MTACTTPMRIRTSFCLILTVLLALMSVLCISPKMAAAQTTSTIQNSGSVTVTDADRAVDAVALEILCKTHGNFDVLQTYMKSQGWVRGGMSSGIVYESLVPSNLTLTMDRYYCHRGLHEPEVGVNYVDEGAASVALLGRDNSGITVTWQSGSDVWTKAVTSY